MSFAVSIPRQLSRHLSRLRDLARQSPSDSTPLQGNHNSLPNRLADVFLRTWDLGFTAFGGPPVHFQILHQRFVDGKGGKQKWVDEETVRLHFPCAGFYQAVMHLYAQILRSWTERDRDPF